MRTSSKGRNVDVPPQENPLRHSPPSKPSKPSRFRQPVYDHTSDPEHAYNDGTKAEESKDFSSMEQNSVQRRPNSIKIRERDRIAAQRYIDSLEEGNVSPPPFISQTPPYAAEDTISELSPAPSASTYRHLSVRSPTLVQSQRLGSSRMKTNGLGESAISVSAVSSPNNGTTDRTKLILGNKIVAENIIQYGLWAHYLSYGAAAMCLCMGVFAIAWKNTTPYNCKIDGKYINIAYLPTSDGECPTSYGSKKICCYQPSTYNKANKYVAENTPILTTHTLIDNLLAGLLYISYGAFIILMENTTWGFGLYFPTDTIFFRNRVSLIGLSHLMVGFIGLFNYATCMPGVFLLTAGLVYCYAAYRREGGDGGRADARKAAASAAAGSRKMPAKAPPTMWQNLMFLSEFNPVAFFRRIYREDKLSSYVWVCLFIIANIITFVYTVFVWLNIVNTMKQKLKDGTLNVLCADASCHLNRKVVRYGPISIYGALAKGCGACLNLNGSLLLLPVIRMLIRKLNDAGQSFNALQHSTGTDYFAKVFAHPLTRYVPLQKNIEFHKICAGSIFFLSWLHMGFHFINLIYANATTLRLFRMWGWNGTAYLTGAIVSFAMFIIYTAASDEVRRTKYEIFFNAHHFFTVFFLVMFLHGPSFFYWTGLPVLLYILERLMRVTRGSKPFLLVKVEWLSPVMAVYFRPVFKEDFKFKEGQYLYLNVPHVSQNEWHPFTISSATDDMKFGPRMHLLTGEEVVEVPRPRNLPPHVKWSKFCRVSQVPNDWSVLDESYLLDKSDTGYHDYISVHIKVHGLDEPKARTWTRKVKEYFELLSPQQKFPFYFKRLDDRGDVLIGKRYGPDNLPIIRVDGPHSAPSEHYCNYGTVMIIGAGIGLTPCASILAALTKYKWKKNFNPEILHLYWVVRQNEVESFQWMVHMLTELSYELLRGKATNQISAHYYCEINIYVTAVEKGAKDVPRLSRPPRNLNNTALPSAVKPLFTAEELFKMMVNPTVESKGQIKKMASEDAPNRLQDIWIWNGRPHWDDIFAEMLKNRQHSDIGVCFCGAPVIGADLATMCEKYSSIEKDCYFSLHKENF
eukprot:gene33073-42785_t